MALLRGSSLNNNFNMKKVITVLTLIFSTFLMQSQNNYEANWKSLSNYEAPEWYEDAKLGFWVHWGVYSVPAYMGDHASEWYGRWMYAKELQTRWNMGLATHKHHLEKYGNPSEFGYKDFIPMFKAEKFDADEWAQLFVDGGAKYFTMMGVHHDSFCLWDTKLSKWNSVQMGPKRDLVGEISKAVRKKGLKFGVSNHSAWNSTFFTWNHVNKYDAADIANQDLYGNPIISPILDTIQYIEGEGRKGWLERVNGTSIPSDRDLNRWIARTKELADLYQPDLYYFDWGMNTKFFESRRKEFGAHYYNKALEWKKGKFGNPGVVINYKNEAFAKGSAVHDHERGGEGKIAPMVWQTDDCVYDGHTWGYSEGVPIKKANTIIDELVDIVSKRGVLMLSFAPKADGTFPEDQKKLARDMGAWLKVCGEAIYATRPWVKHGEGYDKKSREKPNVANVRFTRSKSKTELYATLIEWQEREVVIKSINNTTLSKHNIKKICLLGINKSLKWEMDDNGLTVQLPKKEPYYKHAYPIKIQLKKPMKTFN